MYLLQSFLVIAVSSVSFGLTIHTVHSESEYKKPIPILKQDFHIHDEGYQYGFETANGIHVQETGYIKNKGDKEHETIVQQGEVTYHDEHGNPITLTYIADEHGFQPQGAHLPTPPRHSIGITKHSESEEQPEDVAVHEEVNAQQYHHFIHELV